MAERGDGATGSGSRWDSSRAGSYDQAWQKLAESGQSIHGEVDFVQRFEPATVLDAGCGTGRVAIELAARGVDVVGSDIDDQMLSQAREKAPEVDWVQSDLAALDLGREFDVVVMAGNVVLFVAPGSEAEVVAGAARHVAPGGRLVAGFSLGRDVTVESWEGWLRAAGLEPVARYSSWSGDPFEASSDYLVSVAARSD